MNLENLIASFGELSEGEIVAGCRVMDPDIDSYEAARFWLWSIIRKLIESHRFKAASMMVTRMGWDQEFKDLISTRKAAEGATHRLDDYDRLAMEWL